MAKHKPYSQEVPHLIKYIKVYATIVAIAGAAIVVFRAHCLNSGLLMVVIFAASIPIAFAVSVAIAGILQSVFSMKKITDNLASIVSALSFLAAIFVLFEANNLYYSTLLKGDFKVVEGVIVKREIRKSRYDSWAVLVYSYNYNGNQYHDEIYEDETNLHVGDYIQVSVSTFDATVHEVLP